MNKFFLSRLTSFALTLGSSLFISAFAADDGAQVFERVFDHIPMVYDLAIGMHRASGEDNPEERVSMLCAERGNEHRRDWGYETHSFQVKSFSPCLTRDSHTQEINPPARDYFCFGKEATISRDGAVVATALNRGSYWDVDLMDIDKGKGRGLLMNYEKLRLVLSDNGAMLAVAGALRRSTPKIKSGTWILNLYGQHEADDDYRILSQAQVRAFSFDPSTTHLVIAADGSPIAALHDLRIKAAGEAVGVEILEGQENVNCFAWGNENLLAAGDDQAVINVWDVSTHECLHKLMGHETGVTSLDWHYPSSSLASGDKNGRIQWWKQIAGGFNVRKKLQERASLKDDSSESSAVTHLRFNTQGDRLVGIIGRYPRAHTWYLRENKAIDSDLTPAE